MSVRSWEMPGPKMPASLSFSFNTMHLQRQSTRAPSFSCYIERVPRSWLQFLLMRSGTSSGRFRPTLCHTHTHTHSSRPFHTNAQFLTSYWNGVLFCPIAATFGLLQRQNNTQGTNDEALVYLFWDCSLAYFGILGSNILMYFIFFYSTLIIVILNVFYFDLLYFYYSK